jgi:hypothetical protein
LDQLARRAIELIREFYEDRITDSRALAQFNTCETQIEAAEAAIESPESFTPEDTHAIQETLEKQEACASNRRSNDKVKSKLREFLNEATMKKRRKAALLALPTITKRLAKRTTSAKSKQTENGKSKESKGRKEKEQTSKAAAPRVDFEAVLSDIIAVLETKLAEGDEVVTELGEAITTIFVRYGLIDADE